jgi:hypothetical protein
MQQAIEEGESPQENSRARAYVTWAASVVRLALRHPTHSIRSREGMCSLSAKRPSGCRHGEDDTPLWYGDNAPSSR